MNIRKPSGRGFTFGIVALAAAIATACGSDAPACHADGDIPASTDRGRDNRCPTTYRDCKNRAVHRYSRRL